MAGLGTGHVTRERLTFAIAVAAIAVAAITVFLPGSLDRYPNQLAWDRFRVATSMLGVAFAFAMRRWPGIVAIILVFAVEPMGEVLDNAVPGQAMDSMGEPTGIGEPTFLFSFLSVIVRMTVPALILGVYATAPERRLARWVTPVAGLVVVLTILGAGARYLNNVENWANPTSWSPLLDMAWNLDNPAFPWLVAVLGALGSLRSAGRRYVAPAVSRTAAVGPTRPIVLAAAVATLLWVPAGQAFLGRVSSIDTPYDGSDRWLWLPVLLALVAIVASRWSLVAAWAAIAGAFQANAFLTFYRGLAEIVAIALAVGPDAPTPVTPGYQLFSTAGVLIQAFAFGALALAVVAVWRSDAVRADRVRWALLGAVSGVLVCGWYIVGAALTSGFPFSIEVLLLPAYPFLALLVALVLWRRLVPAVAEAEAIATRPLQPLRYLETIVAETISGGAESRRRAVEAERARLASTLHAEFLPNLERLASRTAAGAPPEEVAERLRELQDEVRRLMAERRLVVLEEFGIVEALEWLVAQAEERVSFPIELTVDDASMPDRPPREVERAAFRIAQLAVENAIQHAGPSRLALHVLARPERPAISVADDGQWVTPSATDRRRDHVGIADMRSEANHVRAAVEVRPSDGGGTTVQFAWPALAATPGRAGPPIAPPPSTAPTPAPGSTA